MGDRRRFDLFADLILRQFPSAPSLPIADVAGGKGQLRAAFHSRGVRNVTTWDKRRSMPAHRPGYRRALFDYRTAPGDAYGLVLGMHPDEGTDHIVLFAARNRVPFAVCPCCVKPSAAQFHGRDYEGWCKHIAGLARAGGMSVDVFDLPMKGCSTVIVGKPN